MGIQFIPGNLVSYKFNSIKGSCGLVANGHTCIGFQLQLISNLLPRHAIEHHIYQFYLTFSLIHLTPKGKEETRADKLRSIVAQMEYSYQIHKWVEKGVPFSTNLYVPETHPLTLAQFHEREDERHVFKVHILWLWQFLVHVNPAF